MRIATGDWALSGVDDSVRSSSQTAGRATKTDEILEETAIQTRSSDITTRQRHELGWKN